MYTKKKRNSVYKQALKLIENHDEHYACIAVGAIVDPIEKEIKREDFSELFLFNDEDGDGGSWLTYHDENSNYCGSSTPKGRFMRELVLNFCIEMTNEN
jgi:hypothetical protein